MVTEAPTANAASSATVPTAAESADQSTGRPTTPGKSIDRYMVLDTLGEGGMGVVLRAYDPKLHREVALKLIKTRQRERAEGAKARLMREAQTMARLSHPNVVPVFDVGTYGSALYVAMELVEGDNLRGWLQRAPRSVEDIVDAFAQAARGLVAAHEAGLIHRDLKPGNLLVGVDGRVRVVDFGLARAVESNPPSTGETGSDAVAQDHLHEPLTEAGSVVGTPAYMAPEQHRGGEIDHRSDQYALCLTLYEALYLRRPFHARDTKALARLKMDGPPDEGGRDDVPRRVVRAMQRGLQPDPADRWPSMAALAEELQPTRPKSSSRGVAVASTIAIGGLAVWAMGAVGETNPCPEIAASIELPWSDAKAEALHHAYIETEVTNAEPSSKRIREALDGYYQDWRATRLETCEATRVRAEVSADTRVARVACLQHLQARADALLQVLLEPSPDIIAYGDLGALDLRAPATCLEVAAATAPAASDSATRDAVIALAAALSAGAAIDDESVSKAEHVHTDAQAGDDERLKAEAEYQLGARYLAVFRIEEAIASLERSYFAAGRHDQHALAMRGAMALAEAQRLRGGTREAADWAWQAAMMAERGKLSARLRVRSAVLLAVVGASDERLPRLEQSVALGERELGDSDIDTARAVHQMALHLLSVGDLDAAERTFTDALVRLHGSRGPGHPDIAMATIGVADLDIARGRLDIAQSKLEAAADSLRGSLGPRHHATTVAVARLARAYGASGQHDDAVRLARNVVAMRQQALRTDDLRVADAKLALAEALTSTGAQDEVVTLARGVLAIHEATLPPTHASITRARALLPSDP